MNLQNTIAVITGGASGAGKATAQLFSTLGCKILILDKNESEAQKAAGAMDGLAVACDVTSESEVSKALDMAIDKFKCPIGILVNCAGIVYGGRIVGKSGLHDLTAFENTLKVNVLGSFNTMRLVASKMIENAPQETGERGVIINTASIAAFDGQIGQAAYSASKGAVVSMALPAAREFAQFGIRVMTIAPGFIETPMMAQLPDKVRTSLEQQTPFPKRFGKPEEFAQLAQSIIENPMLNGEVIRLDGAVRMQPQ